MKIKKRPKICCEVCGETDKSTLHRHHTVERVDPNTTNDDYNLCIVCSNCHNKIHAGTLKIIGVFPGTRPPSGRILIYVLNGVCNVPGLENAEPPYQAKAPSMKLYNKQDVKIE